MNNPINKKDIKIYINPNIFISHLDIPLYETSVNSDDSKFLNNLKVINEKLDVLLKIPHQEFWCHIIFDCSILSSIQSYFNHVIRPYEIAIKNISRDKLEIEVYKKYYLVILKMTSKNENLSVFSNLNFGSLIYDNFVIDMPFIFDLCSIYGDGNSEMISKIITFIFQCQPKYFNDFQQYTEQSMKFLEEKINSLTNNSNKLINRNNLMIKNHHTSEQKSEEFLYYIIDLFYGWNALLDAIKTESEIYTILFKISFHKSLEKSFEKYVPIIQPNIDKFETVNPENLKKLLSISCYYLISVWRKIFSAKFLESFLGKSSILTVRSSEENYELINNCLSIISGCQEYPIFADAMYLMFPIRQDFDIILQAVKSDKDEYYEDFVKNSINEIIREIDSRQTMFSSKCSIANDLLSPSSLSLPTAREINIENENQSIDLSILQIIEIFPSLSVKDIKNYMQCYTCGSEDMLDALLAEAITVDFVKNTSNANSKINSTKELSNYQTILNNHISIYDGDALDTGKVTSSQLHIGKRQTGLSETIDPQLQKMILNIVVQQNEEEENELSIEQQTYDDEFDDVYGISHNSVVVDNKIEESNYESDNLSKNKDDPKIEDKSNIMEPSKIKYSAYDKNQFKKKKFQENQHKVSSGEKFSHRMGSHASKDTTFTKKSHRSKAQNSDV